MANASHPYHEYVLILSDVVDLDGNALDQRLQDLAELGVPLPTHIAVARSAPIMSEGFPDDHVTVKLQHRSPFGLFNLITKGAIT